MTEQLVKAIAGLPANERPQVLVNASAVGIYGDRLKVAVKAPPDRGRANKELVQLLATALELRSDQVEVVRGQTSRDKTVRLSGASGDELERRLLALVETILD